MLLNFCFILSYLICLISVMLSVAFMILFERKVLGYIQLRKGPNKVGFGGILQSFGDALKLLVKEYIFPFSVNIFLYLWAPIIMLLLVMLMWNVLFFYFNCFNSLMGVLFFLCMTSLGVYSLVGGGWASNSSYALLGSIRGLAQTISYEVSMALILISLVFFSMSYSFMNISISQYMIFNFLNFFPLFFCWVVSSLAETNRTPFDFSEGESELVSGFNVEYSSGGFTFLFLSEYASIIFMSFMLNFLFFYHFNILMLTGMSGGAIIFLFIWVRGCLPRYRYDKLMSLMWKCYLPFTLIMMLMYLFLNFLFI